MTTSLSDSSGKSVSMTFLVFDDLDISEESGSDISVGCLSIGICLNLSHECTRVLDFREKDHRAKVPFLPHHSRVQTIDVTDH